MINNAFVLVSSLFAMLIVSTSGAQVPDSCLVLGRGINPDSVMVDTCGADNVPESSRLYARGWFMVLFDYYVIDLPAAPADSVIDVDWRVIDSRYTALRSTMESIEQRFGAFRLRKFSPEITDTASTGSKLFALRFADLVNIDTATEELTRLPHTSTRYMRRHHLVSSVPSRQRVTAARVWPMPATNVAFVSADCVSDATVLAVDQTGRSVSVPANCELSDVSGSRVLRVDVSGLPSGMYSLRVGDQVATALIVR